MSEKVKSISLATHTRLDLLDLAILLVNVWQAAEDKHIGFEDSEQTIDDLTAKLSHPTWVSISDLESALWSCNLRDEKKTFWHPRGYSFDLFVNKILRGKKFDKFTHMVER